MEITAEIHYDGEPIQIKTLIDGEPVLSLQRGKDKMILGWDEMNDIVGICKMLKWEDFS